MNYIIDCFNGKNNFARKIAQRIALMLLSLLFINNLYSQSSFSLNGGFNQSLFYCGQSKSDYYHSYTPYNSYLVNFSYRENLSVLQKNLQVGAQLEFKQQSAWFYYEDLYPTDTVATGVRYDIRSINLYLFPELRVGEYVRFVFSGGPVIQYIVNVKAKGKQVQLMSGSSNVETDIDEKNSKDISGFTFGVKINFGVEIPIYKGLYLAFCNSYSAGFTGMGGELSKRMKFFNCIDINLSGGIVYQVNHKDWFSNRKK